MSTDPSADLQPARHRRRDHVARLPVIIFVAGLLVMGGLADRSSRGAQAPAGVALRPMPVAAPASALSSSWFCAGAIGPPGPAVAGAIFVANTTAQPRHGTATLTTNRGPLAPIPIDVGPYARSTLAETAAGAASFVGAVVDMDGGGVAVEQVVNSATGVSTAACATTGSDQWYFADGTTQENANLYLSLLNPYPEDAIVDLSFVTEQGTEQPADFQGIVVPARGLVGVDVGSHLRRRARIAVTASARAGRIVAWKTEIVTAPPSAGGQSLAGPQGDARVGAPRVPGLSLVLGAPAPATAWWWPDGLAADGVIERYQVYNPGPTEADVSLALMLDQGSAEPFRLKIAPHDSATVIANNESRIPKGVAHAAMLQSTNGVGVVAERTVDAATPSQRSGLLDLLGSQLAARRWVLPSGATNPGLDEWVVVFNPDPAGTTISIAALAGGPPAPINGLSDISLPAGRRLAVRINDHAPNLNAALLVEAGSDVVVEGDLYPTKSAGLAGAMGIPLGD